MIGIDEVANIIRTSPSNSYQRGCSAAFKKINDEWGIKFYVDDGDRDKTWNLQNIASEMGLAPRVGQKFELTLPESEESYEHTVYGYVTECADVYAGGDITSDEWDKADARLEEDEEYNELLEKLGEKMWTSDMHAGNVGYLRGKMVAIDFSECSLKRGP